MHDGHGNQNRETSLSHPLGMILGMSECGLCLDELDHCHDVSIEHADGSTECMDPSCRLGHEAHGWQLSCSGLEPPCPCVPEEQLPPLLLAA